MASFRYAKCTQVMSGLTAQAKAASLARSAERLTESRSYLSTSNNPGSRNRIAEIDEELKRIARRLTELA